MSDGRSLSDLVDLMRLLLSPEGCPWDREQTLESLRPYVIEEAFEVVDAIDRGEPDALRDELGDLLLQVVFQAELCQRNGWFTIDDVVSAIVQKLRRRHPWVFGDATASSSTEVVGQWEAIKAKERKANSGALSGVPVAMPSLLRALRIGEKASAVGYDWPDAGGPREKINEELRELDEAAAAGDLQAVQSELGDVLFALATYARKHALDPEAALRGTLDRFSARFALCEAEAQRESKSLRDFDSAELDAMWERAKAQLRG